MGCGPSEDNTPPVHRQNPRQRGGPCGRSDNEVAILSGRGLCFRCGIKGHRATDEDAPCKGHPVMAAAAIPALSHASSAQSSATKTNPAPAATASRIARKDAASGDAAAATASARLFGAAHSRPAIGRTVASVGRTTAPVGMSLTTAVGWTRWESHAGSETHQNRLDEDGNPWMEGDKILSAEKLDTVEYGGTRNDRDLGLCKSCFLLGTCDFHWFWCPFRHWKPEGCERTWMSEAWWQKHMRKFNLPIIPPDHPNAKYAGAPRTYFNGTQFIPRQLVEAEAPSLNAWFDKNSFKQAPHVPTAEEIAAEGMLPEMNSKDTVRNADGTTETTEEFRPAKASTATQNSGSGEWAEDSEDPAEYAAQQARQAQREKASRGQKRGGFRGQGRGRGGLGRRG